MYGVEPIDLTPRQGEEARDQTDRETDTTGADVRRSSRSRKPISRLDLGFKGKYHAEKMAAATVEGSTDSIQEDSPVIHPDSHLSIDMCAVTHTIMTQLSMKPGLKEWGERAVVAISKEVGQLHM